MKKFFLNKFLILFSVFLCLITLISVPSFATDGEYSFTGPDYKTYTVPSLPNDGFKHFIIVLSGKDIHFYNFSGSLSVTKFSDNGFKLTFDGTSSSYSHYNLENGAWKKYGSSGSYTYSSSMVINSCNCLLQDIDKINKVPSAEEGSPDSNFFYDAPTVVVDGTLAQIVEVTPLEGVLMEIVEILPIVLLTLVGLIGLRKALSMLSKVLHQS